MAYCSAFLEQSEKSTGTRIFCNLKAGAAAIDWAGIWVSLGPNSTRTPPFFGVGLIFITMPFSLSYPLHCPALIDNRTGGAAFLNLANPCRFLRKKKPLINPQFRT